MTRLAGFGCAGASGVLLVAGRLLAAGVVFAMSVALLWLTRDRPV